MTDAGAAPEEYRDRVSPGKSWTEIVALVGDLPPLPQVASQAMALVENPRTTADQLTNLLGKDPALASRVMKVANSAMFSRRREIKTLNQAIVLIGFKTMRGVIVAATLRQLDTASGDLERMLWENATCTAAAAQALAQHRRTRFAEEAYLLGLLHDLGKFVLARQVPAEYARVVEETRRGGVFVDVEQEVLGYAHPLIGALVAKKWNFPLDTCQVILHHHDPLDPSLPTALDQRTAIVQAADLMAHQLGYGHPEGYPDCAPQLEAALRLLGIEAEAQERLLAQVRDAVSEVDLKG